MVTVYNSNAQMRSNTFFVVDRWKWKFKQLWCITFDQTRLRRWKIVFLIIEVVLTILLFTYGINNATTGTCTLT